MINYLLHIVPFLYLAATLNLATTIYPPSISVVPKSVYCMLNYLLHGLEGFLNAANKATLFNVVWD